MQWMRFRKDGQARLGVLNAGELRDLTAVADAGSDVGRALADADLVALLTATPDPAAAVTDLLERAPSMDVEAVAPLTPIARPPKNVVCVGRNYYEHAMEAARYRGTEETVPEYPIFFTKPHTAITDPDVDVHYDPGISDRLDYEGEVALIIGRGGKDIPAREALEHVWGLTLFNDLSIRDVQGRHLQWYKGKGVDQTAPMGPVVVTLDEIADLKSVSLRATVNGELRQEATLSQLIFDIPTLIESWSRGMTIEPGDVLATGTPSGVGAGFDPPRFLGDGDVVEVSSDELGVLRNRIHFTS